MSISRFWMYALIITLALGAAGFWVIDQYAQQYNLLAVAAALIIMFLATGIAYSLTYLGIDKNAKQFTTLFMAGMVAKMAVGIVSVLITAVLFKEFVNEYVVAFFTAYFILTGFEVFGLIRKLRAVS